MDKAVDLTNYPTFALCIIVAKEIEKGKECACRCKEKADVESFDVRFFFTFNVPKVLLFGGDEVQTADVFGQAENLRRVLETVSAVAHCYGVCFADC